MSKQNLINKYNGSYDSLTNQVSSMEDQRLPIQSSINDLIIPASLIDKRIAELTSNINANIEQLSIISNNAYSCGCGTTLSVIVPGPGGVGTTTVTIISGSTYYYENAKAHRINAENSNYYGYKPNGGLDGTDGTTSFNTGIGAATTVVGYNYDSILELTINNAGVGFAASTYYSQTLTGGSGTGAKADITVGTAGTVTTVIVNNGGSGYKINEILTSSSFVGASFKITNLGSPILGVGTDTYILASSGVGTVFIPDVISSNVSICSTSCSSYSSSTTTILNTISSLRTQRDSLLVYTNQLKNETRRLYIQRYGYVSGEASTNSRKTEVNNIINILNNQNLNQYFV